MKDTNLPITDIAYTVGFYDYNHFSRIFKQVTGTSARLYRKNNSQFTRKAATKYVLTVHTVLLLPGEDYLCKENRLIFIRQFSLYSKNAEGP